MRTAQPQQHRRVPARTAAVASVLALVLLLVAVLGFVNLLRHPFPDERIGLPPEQAGDPRLVVECPDPQEPGDGQGAGVEPQVGPALPPAEVTSNEVYDCPQTWHERRVRYRGEAIGAVLRRGDGAWVQLNDDIYAVGAGPLPVHRDFRGGNAGIGVFVPLELADQIEHVGGPRLHGDMVEVVGTFRRIDPRHREVAVIIAEGGEVVSPGGPVSHPLLADRAVAAAVLGLLAAGLVVTERVVTRRRR